MKRTCSVLMGALVLGASLHAQTMSSEEAAIKKTIEAETQYWLQRDYEHWADTWTHESSVYRSYATPKYHAEQAGWKAISQWCKNSFANSPEPLTWTLKKTDYKFIVSGTMAFVTFLENGNASTRVLRKERNKWKLVGMTVVDSQAFSALAQENKFKKFVGEWKAKPSSIAEDPGWPGEKLVGLDMSITYSEGSLKRQIVSHYKTNSGGYDVHVDTTLGSVRE